MPRKNYVPALHFVHPEGWKTWCGLRIVKDDADPANWEPSCAAPGAVVRGAILCTKCIASHPTGGPQ